MSEKCYLVLILCPGDGNLTAVLPNCPNDAFTFLCTVVGDSNASTHWQVGNRESPRECFLPHSTMNNHRPCGSFIAKTETGFGTTDATLFTSTLSGTATSELSGILVECFCQHPDSNCSLSICRGPENMVGNTTLQIIGQ